jgi:hypothetical protein
MRGMQVNCRTINEINSYRALLKVKEIVDVIKSKGFAFSCFISNFPSYFSKPVGPCQPEFLPLF